MKDMNLKWGVSAYEHVEDDAQGPDIDSGGVVGIAEEDLGRRIGQGSARSLQLLARIVFVGEAEVGEFDHAQFLEEDHVLRFEIAVDDVQLVAVGYGVHHLQFNQSFTQFIHQF